MNAKLRVVYFGSGSFGVPSLARLVEEHQVTAVVTQPDRPAGRSQKPTPTPIAQWVASHHPGLLIFKPANVNDVSASTQIRSLPADAFVVIAFGQKLGQPLLADRFAINLHASRLPRWRGAAPINHAILAGDAETGNSVITVTEKMDAGDVLAQSTRAIDPGVTAGELHDQLAEDGPALVLDVLSRQAAKTLSPQPQDAALVTLAPKLSKTDGWVVFSQPAEMLRRRIHGLTPWPGVAVLFRGEPLKILHVRCMPAPGLGDSPSVARPVPGTIVDAGGGIVACGGGTTIRILDVQPAGGKTMPWSDFARGKRVQASETLVGGKAC